MPEVSDTALLVITNGKTSGSTVTTYTSTASTANFFDKHFVGKVSGSRFEKETAHSDQQLCVLRFPPAGLDLKSNKISTISKGE